MSGQQIGMVVGGVIGFYFGGPAGAQFGMAVGGAVGGAVDPETIRAPSIGDAQQQTTAAGVPRPVVYGHPAPFAGNLIDGEHKARKIIVTEGGKGGPEVESERFLLTSAIRICEGPIAGIVRIWRNGEVVYDRRTIDDMPQWGGGSVFGIFQYIAEVRAWSMAFQQRARIYLGDEDQLPDPALEAIHGVGNTPYYKGTAYMVIEDDDVTDTRGACARYEFEVMSAGTEAETVIVAPSLTRDDTPFWSGFGTGRRNWVESVETTSDMALMFRMSGHVVTNMACRLRLAPVYTPWAVAPESDPTESEYNYVAANAIYDTGWWASSEEDAQQFRDYEASEGRAPPKIQIGTPGEAVAVIQKSAWGLIAMADMFHTGAGTASMDIAWPNVIGVTGVTSPDAPGVMMGSDGNVYVPAWGSESLKSITANPVTLSSVIESIADRCGVPAANINATALAPIIIPGFLIAVQGTGADCLRPTQQMYFYDMPEFDGGIVAVPRGGASVATIADDDMLEAGDEDDDTRAQAIEFPLKVSVITRDPAAEYAPMPQTSTRYSNAVVALGEASIASPIPFGADEAKQRADIIHKVLWAQAEGRSEFELPEEWTHLVPSDCFERDGKRWLIESVEYAEGAVRVKSVYDRATNYVSTATGIAAPLPVLPTFPLKGPTLLVAMNLPPLSEVVQEEAGVYLAATGTFTGWDGCIVQMSVDGGATYRTVATISRRSVMGRLLGDITTTTEPILVELDSGELSSTTADRIALGSNGFAMISSNVAEIAQFETATEDSEGDYSLTTVTRAALGTTAAAHSTGDRFVMLENAVFLPVDSSLAGTTLYFRAVTNGTAADNNAVVTLPFDPVPVEVIIDGGEI